MSTEMSLAKLSQRLVPPILNSQAATCFAALHPLAPAPIPFWMSKRFYLSTDLGHPQAPGRKISTNSPSPPG